MITKNATSARIVERLARAGCIAANEEADELIAKARSTDELEAMIRRREQGEPLEWITESATFCGQLITVLPGVYVPRPQTEELAMRAGTFLKAIGDDASAVDLCTGSGVVASHLSNVATSARVIATELDPVAAMVAKSNGVTVVCTDLANGLADSSFDLVTAVPPYVPRDELDFLPRDTLAFEPLIALDGGVAGLEVLCRVVTSAARILRTGGALFVELGGNQDELLSPTLLAAGFAEMSPFRDEEGDLRGIASRWTGFR